MQNLVVLVFVFILLMVVILVVNFNLVVLIFLFVCLIVLDRVVKKFCIDFNLFFNFGISFFLITFVVIEQEMINLNGLVMILVVVLVYVFFLILFICDWKQLFFFEKLLVNWLFNVSSFLEVLLKFCEFISRDFCVLFSFVMLLFSILMRMFFWVDVFFLLYLLNSKIYVVSNCVVILYYLYIVWVVLKYLFWLFISKVLILLIKMEVVCEYFCLK